MINVHLTANLKKYYPEKEFQIEADNVLQLLQKMDKVRPGFSTYIVDEAGVVRRHVNIFVNQELLAKENTKQVLKPGFTVHIMQALSGG